MLAVIFSRYKSTPSCSIANQFFFRTDSQSSCNYNYPLIFYSFVYSGISQVKNLTDVRIHKKTLAEKLQKLNRALNNRALFA